MKVAIIVPRFPVPSETFVVARFVRLIDRGFDVHVFCEELMDDHWSWFDELRPEHRSRVHVRTRAPSRLRIALTLPLVLSRALAIVPRAALRYIDVGLRAYGRGVATHFVEDEALVRLQPDVVHFEFGNLAVNREATGRALAAKLVVTFQGYDINYAGLDDPSYYEKLWDAVDAVRFVSADLFIRAQRRGFANADIAHIVHNGIDTSRFVAPDRVAPKEASGPLRVLGVGRLHWKKGYNVALQAIRILRDRGIDVRYRIVGDGEGRDSVLFDIDDLGLHDCVELLGPLPAQRVREELTAADVFLHAAISEGFCIAVTEAQAMAVPVVTSDADGLSENVADGETGFVAPRRDPSSLADALMKLANDVELRTAMGAAGRRRAETLFDIELEIDAVERLYEKAVSGPHSRAV